ncbi:MAG: flavodoxin family protein [Propionibacteriaceae bacterium]|nr:flavodoxin family protein [Propionibacteriaceae bacterium]
MRVFAYVASRRRPVSNTVRLLDLFVDQLRTQLAEPVDLKVARPFEWDLRNCLGCEKCFNAGRCPLDRTDNFDRIKEEMLSADLIILGTPVYAGMMSGDLKTFMDRLAYWCHLMRLAGRYGIPLVTASTNHALETTATVAQFLEYLGLCVPFTIPCNVDVPAMLEDPRFAHDRLGEYAGQLANLYSVGTLTASTYQQRYFTNLQRMYGDDSIPETVEVKFWRQHGYLQFTEFADLQAALRKVQQQSSDFINNRATSEYASTDLDLEPMLSANPGLVLGHTGPSA